MLHVKSTKAMNEDENYFIENINIRSDVVGYKSNESPWCKCPVCGSYNYVVGYFTSIHNCKCNDCGSLFYFKFS